MDIHNTGPVSVDSNIPQSTKEQNNRKKRNVRNVSQIVFSDNYSIKNDSPKKHIRRLREPLEGELICVPCENDLLWKYKTQGDKEQDFDNTSNANDFHV